MSHRFSFTAAWIISTTLMAGSLPAFADGPSIPSFVYPQLDTANPYELRRQKIREQKREQLSTAAKTKTIAVPDKHFSSYASHNGPLRVTIPNLAALDNLYARTPINLSPASEIPGNMDKMALEPAAGGSKALAITITSGTQDANARENNKPGMLERLIASILPVGSAEPKPEMAQPETQDASPEKQTAQNEARTLQPEIQAPSAETQTAQAEIKNYPPEIRVAQAETQIAAPSFQEESPPQALQPAIEHTDAPEEPAISTAEKADANKSATLARMADNEAAQPQMIAASELATAIKQPSIASVQDTPLPYQDAKAEEDPQPVVTASAPPLVTPASEEKPASQHPAPAEKTFQTADAEPLVAPQPQAQPSVDALVTPGPDAIPAMASKPGQVAELVEPQAEEERNKASLTADTASAQTQQAPTFYTSPGAIFDRKHLGMENAHEIVLSKDASPVTELAQLEPAAGEASTVDAAAAIPASGPAPAASPAITPPAPSVQPAAPAAAANPAIVPLVNPAPQAASAAPPALSAPAPAVPAPVTAPATPPAPAIALQADPASPPTALVTPAVPAPLVAAPPAAPLAAAPAPITPAPTSPTTLPAPQAPAAPAGTAPPSITPPVNPVPTAPVAAPPAPPAPPPPAKADTSSPKENPAAEMDLSEPAIAPAKPSAKAEETPKKKKSGKAGSSNGAILSHIPSDIDSDAAFSEPFSIDHAKPPRGVLKAAPQATAHHEAMGIKIEVKKPSMDVNYELERAYDASVAGNSQAAMEIYRNVLDNDPANANALFGLATLYQRAGRPEQARPLYARLLAVDPNNREGLNNFLALMAEDSPNEALGQLEKLERRNPNFSPIQAQMAMVYEKTGQPEQAIGKMMKALELSPENMTYRYNLAIMLDKNKKYEQAAPLYRELVQAYQKGESIPGNIQNIQQRLTFISSNRP